MKGYKRMSKDELLSIHNSKKPIKKQKKESFQIKKNKNHKKSLQTNKK